MKHRHFPCEALNQNWTGDRGFQKLEEDAEEHRTKSLSQMVNKLGKMAACSEAHVCLVFILLLTVG